MEIEKKNPTFLRNDARKMGCSRERSEARLSSCTRTISKWGKHLKTRNFKSLRRKNTLQNVGTGKDFWKRSPVVQETGLRIGK